MAAMKPRQFLMMPPSEADGGEVTSCAKMREMPSGL
jgi:hypothetical protein